MSDGFPSAEEEVNPEHRVTKTLHAHWHKVCLALLVKLSPNKEIVITPKDMDKIANLFPGDDPAILAHDKSDGLHLSVISMKWAKLKAVQ
jgi:hypothetical protein